MNSLEAVFSSISQDRRISSSDRKLLSEIFTRQDKGERVTRYDLASRFEVKPGTIKKRIQALRTRGVMKSKRIGSRDWHYTYVPHKKTVEPVISPTPQPNQETIYHDNKVTPKYSTEVPDLKFVYRKSESKSMSDPLNLRGIKGGYPPQSQSNQAEIFNIFTGEKIKPAPEFARGGKQTKSINLIKLIKHKVKFKLTNILLKIKKKAKYIYMLGEKKIWGKAQLGDTPDIPQGIVKFNRSSGIAVPNLNPDFSRSVKSDLGVTRDLAIEEIHEIIRKQERDMPVYGPAEGLEALFGEIEKVETKPRKKRVPMSGQSRWERFEKKEPKEYNVPDLEMFFKVQWEQNALPGKPFGWSQKDRGQMKMLVNDQGPELVAAYIQYVLTNWTDLRRRYNVHGSPNVAVMFGYRSSWFPESIEGPPSTNQKGATFEWSDNKDKEDLSWG